jgi:hypothetical protein
MCVQPDQRRRFPEGSRLVDFIGDLVVPYLYGLSFFELRGRWPWRDFSHGALGLLEYYAEQSENLSADEIADFVRLVRTDPYWKAFSKQTRKPSGARHCSCGSRRPFQTCHPEAWQGILRLHADIRRLGPNPRRLFHQ